MKKRLLITGANGFVAGSVMWHAGGEWEVHAVDRADIAINRGGVNPHKIELTDAARLKELFGEVKPDAVIHAAAMADIDFCEANKEIAEAVNVGVTREIARNCAACGARLVAISTDTVFGGTKGMYREEDPPEPLNFYAETKVKAERIVAAETPGAAMPRLSLVVGLPFTGGGNSFLSRMIASMEQGKEVGVPDEEIRTPVDVITLGHALLELAGNDYAGLIHLSGGTRLNRYEMSLLIADRLGFPQSLVAAKNPSGIPGRAPRPLDASMDNSKARATLKTPFLSFADELELILKTVEGRK
ncbi:MAG: SDR family oxidoreductase [bacterium]